MELTRKQCKKIREKRQEISHQLVEILCHDCDQEYYLNLMIAQQEVSKMLSNFQDLAFCEWLIKIED